MSYINFLSLAGLKLGDSDLSGDGKGKLLYEGNISPTVYPQDLFQHGTAAYVNFRVKSYDESDTSIYANLFLNMPASLTAQYGAEWEEVSSPLSKLIQVAEDSGATSVFRPTMDAMRNFIAGNQVNLGDALMATMGELGEDASLAAEALMGKGIRNQAVHYAAVNKIKNKYNPAWAYEYRKLLGNQMGAKNLATLNPFVSGVYQHPKFRTFAMQFQFFARNEADAKRTQRIINTFKAAMHPGVLETGQLFWDAPYVFEGTFFTSPTNDKKMFNIKRSALIDLQVNYAGSQVPAFFKDGHPVEISVTATFKEINLLTREDVEKGF